MKIPKTASPSGLSAAFSGVPYWIDEEGSTLKYLCKGELLKGYLGLSLVEQTLVLKWTMCSSASYCFPFIVCSLPWPAHEPQWACICHTYEMPSVGCWGSFFWYKRFFCGICRGQFRNRFAILGLLLLVVSLLNGLIWQVLPWTGQEWLLQWDYCPQPEAWRAMMRPCWSRTTQNPDNNMIMIMILLLRNLLKQNTAILSYVRPLVC